jgi:hypothetical protein
MRLRVVSWLVSVNQRQVHLRPTIERTNQLKLDRRTRREDIESHHRATGLRPIQHGQSMTAMTFNLFAHSTDATGDIAEGLRLCPTTNVCSSLTIGGRAIDDDVNGLRRGKGHPSTTLDEQLQPTESAHTTSKSSAEMFFSPTRSLFIVDGRSASTSVCLATTRWHRLNQCL